MARWTDKSGLKIEASESTLVENALDKMNRLAAAERHMQNPDNVHCAQEEQRQISHDLILKQNVLPYKEHNVWKVLPPPEELIEDMRRRYR